MRRKRSFWEKPAKKLDSRGIFKKGGAALFREYELKASKRINSIAESEPVIAAAGGGVCDNEPATAVLKQNFIFIYIREDARILYQRIIRGGIPAFLSEDNPFDDFISIYKTRTAKYDKMCDICIDAGGRRSDAIAEEIIGILRGANHAG